MRFSIGCSIVLIGVASLVACGGSGSGSSPGSIPNSGSPGSPSTSSKGTQLTIAIDRKVPKSRARSSVKGRRSPLYISALADGLQVAVSTVGSGSTTKTVYADISPTSTLCTTNGTTDIETCVLSIPSLAASEQIVATEVDQPPTGEVNGYGTGFPSTSNILAVGSTEAAITLGALTSITLGLGPVAGGGFYDCSGQGTCAATPQTTPAPNANFGYDISSADAGGGNGPGARIVVTAGVASNGFIEPNFSDAAGNYVDPDTTPLPFVDVNGSPTPITVTSNASTDVSFAPVQDGGTPPPPGAYATTGSIPNDGFQWNDCFFVIGVSVSAALPATATTTSITVDNNLTALSQFTGTAYPQTLGYLIVPVSVAPAAVPVSNTGPVTGSVTGTDYEGAAGMLAESAYAAADGDCNNSSGTTLATVASSGAINTSSWQQSFTITPNNSGTGACTFVLYDENSGVVTQPITVTVSP